MLSLSDFDYHLPKELIAQAPVRPRDRSRLLVLRRRTGQLEHRRFADLADYFEAGDVLVLNDTRVFPARLLGRKSETGGELEIFLLRRQASGEWDCLAGGRGCRPGLKVDFTGGLAAEFKVRNQDGTWRVSFNRTGAQLERAIRKVGRVPLPPYIRREEALEQDKRSYQTVFAAKGKQGSVAAPTAGLHFTPRLLQKLKAKGVAVEYVTLHVGLGTFSPVKTEDIGGHKMHAEWYQVEPDAYFRIMAARAAGRQVVAVGTTVARTLETVAGRLAEAGPRPEAFSGWTDIFIRPGYDFKAVNGLVTNFHTPKSTLLMLVSAFAGQGRAGERAGLDLIKAAYGEAIGQGYRFFSYGDAMFLA